jgi:cysteine desulfurase/selenocysteine lyase
MDPSSVERLFPSVKVGHYFNHAAISPWPSSVANAVRDFATENEVSGPANYRQWIALEKSLKTSLVQLIGASSIDDIALLKNTTEGISTVAWGLDWQAGDNVVLPLDEFSSNRLPWQAQSERGVEVREIDVRTAENAESALIEALDERTRILVVSSVQWNDGFRLDLNTLGHACHQRGILFFVDAIQQLGALKLDVIASHISFLAADAHKWLMGPEGVAVFYANEESRPQLRLHQLGWHMFDNPWSFGRQNWQPASSARRFEAGSPNRVGQAGFKAAIDVLLTEGLERVEDRILCNTEHLLQNLGALKNIRIITRPEPQRRSGIVTFKPENGSAITLHRALAEQKVSCSVRDQAIRLSPHFYQGSAGIDEVTRILEKLL